MTSRLPVRAMTTLTRRLFLRDAFQGVRTFKVFRSRNFLYKGTKPLFVIKLNSRMAPHFRTRSSLRWKATKLEKLKSTLGQHNQEGVILTLLSCPIVPYRDFLVASMSG